MKKWIFTFEELINFTKQNFNDYTIFLKSRLGKRHDGSYICGTCVLSSKEVEIMEVKGSIYGGNLYLITGIDVDNKYIDFNQIGGKKELLEILKGEKE